ncbi:hypothetical protein B0H21DRAFT_452368 [Amylocystis lapponica]|nr:hypothetical protein B0H21DRAFT_452368 [Amylocystis lapponica]
MSSVPTTSRLPHLPFERPSLPIAHLESLKFKANQIVESIQLLQRTLEAGGQNAMPAWPDILSKYNILLSQSHSLSTSLLGQHVSSGVRSSENPYEKITLHPTAAMTDTQLDNELLPLLRTAQTTDVLQLENDVVRHSSEHLASKGVLEVLREAGSQVHLIKPTAYDPTIRECEDIRVEHDLNVERAVRAVAMLREKYDWKARVAVDQEEPEEIEWDPRLGGQAQNGDGPGAAVDGTSEDSGDTPRGGQSNDSDEEEELEEVLGNGADQTPDGTPGGGGSATPMVEG